MDDHAPTAGPEAFRLARAPLLPAACAMVAGMAAGVVLPLTWGVWLAEWPTTSTTS